VIDASQAQAWVEAYERAWRTPGTDGLDALFTVDATYRLSPFDEPTRGLDAISAQWEADRDGPDEEFTMDHEIVAVDDPRAVVRLEVRYRRGRPRRFRDLWILELAADGRCRAFEEWPFTAEQPAPHHVPD
jgi:hypothetical protein